MKGKEIISYIHQGKMPDIEQVRVNCARQTENKSRIKRFRLSTAVAVLAVCLVFTTIAYAVVAFLSERVDLGGNFEILTVPHDYYEREGTMVLNYLYLTGVSLDQQPLFDAKAARLLNELLADKVLTADGTPYELIVPVPGLFSRGYRADDKGNTLYNAEGEEIASILFSATVNSDPQSIFVMTAVKGSPVTQ